MAEPQQQEEQVRLDLEELTRLQGLAKRPVVVSLLSSHIRSLQDQLSRTSTAGAQAKAAPAPVATTSAAAALSYVTLGSFSWDQDNDKLKIYVSLEGVDQEKVDAVFKTMSLDVKFHDVQGKNFRCAIPKLNKEIIPEKCKLVVKPSKVIITLYKASKGNWLDLHFKEDRLKPNLDKDKDPMAGIMDLMRNMYDEGDEDMKRTIAKAWTDARSGKAADPLKNYR
ncbi:hypothetical protein Taro_004023 [Colocasia esculenta]|uniref:Calcyclin-binding protein n=1 Tax=Colocasia esculenta TaxID=4460 RepID=A0A843TNV5_COLES|nr:hypothetical protein [Colocasia esculenta]